MTLCQFLRRLLCFHLRWECWPIDDVEWRLGRMAWRCVECGKVRQFREDRPPVNMVGP